MVAAGCRSAPLSAPVCSYALPWTGTPRRRRAPSRGMDDRKGVDMTEGTGTEPDTATTATTAAANTAGADPLAGVQSGDPDPTPDTFAEGESGCWSQSRDGFEYLCTRPSGHPGQHIAGAGADVAAVWPAEPAATAGGAR